MSQRTGGALAENAFWMVSADILRAIFGFLLMVAILRVGGLEVYGTYRAVISVSSLLTILTGFGLQTSLLKYLTGPDAPSYFTASLLIRLLSSGLVLILVYVLLDPLIGVMKMEGALLIVAALLTFLDVRSILRSVLTANLSMSTFFWAALLGNMLMVTLGVALLLMGLGVVGLLVAYALSNLVTLLAVMPKLPIGFSIPKIDQVKSLISLGLSLWTPMVFRVLGRYSAEIFLFALSGPIQTGKYSVAFAIFNLTLMLLSPVSQLLIPNLERYPIAERQKVIARVTELQYQVLAPVIGLLAVFSDHIMTFFQTDGVLLRTLLISSVLVPIMKANSIMLVREERRSLIAARGIATNAVKLALYYLLTPTMGGMGAAISHTSGEAIRGVIDLRLLRRARLPISRRKVLISVAWGLGPLFLVHLSVLCAILSYVIMGIVFLSSLSDEDRAQLGIVLKTPILLLRDLARSLFG